MEEETLPSPSPIIPLFLLSSQLSRPTRAKMLAYTQANWPMRSCSGLESYLGSRCTTRYWVRGGTLVCCPVLQILTLLYPIKCHFSHPFSYLASKIPTYFQTQTWRWSQNATLHVYIKTEIMLSLLRLKPKEKDVLTSIWNSHITLSFLFIWNWNDEHIDAQP